MWVATETTLYIAGFMQSLVPLLALCAYIPQWRKLWESKSSENISLLAWVIWCVGNVINVFYAVVNYQLTGFGGSLVFSTISVLFFMLINMGFIFYYRRTS